MSDSVIEPSVPNLPRLADGRSEPELVRGDRGPRSGARPVDTGNFSPRDGLANSP
jgi:hypothetical protein